MISANCELNVARQREAAVGEHWRFKAAQLGLPSVSACWKVAQINPAIENAMQLPLG